MTFRRRGGCWNDKGLSIPIQCESRKAIYYRNKPPYICNYSLITHPHSKQAFANWISSMFTSCPHAGISLLIGLLIYVMLRPSYRRNASLPQQVLFSAFQGDLEIPLGLASSVRNLHLTETHPHVPVALLILSRSLATNAMSLTVHLCLCILG